MTKKAIVKIDLFIEEVLGIENYKKDRRNANTRTISPPSRTDPNKKKTIHYSPQSYCCKKMKNIKT